MWRSASERDNWRFVQCSSSFAHISSVKVMETFFVTPMPFLPAPSRRPPFVDKKPSCPSLLEIPILMLSLNVSSLPVIDLGNHILLFYNQFITLLSPLQ